MSSLGFSRKKGTKLPQGAISFGEQVLKCLTRNTRDKYRPNQKKKYNWKLMKLKYLQWFFILDLRLWAKSYGKKKN
jgi:hypothetical protein